MRDEVISSGGAFDPLLLARSSSSPSTPAASSAGASSPAAPTNVVGGGTDFLGHGQGSKAGSQRTSVSTSAGGSAFGSSQLSCRPWEREDLLRRLATFNPSNWFGKPKIASSLACARRGWVNVGVDKIVCESCGANLSFILPSWNPTEGLYLGALNITFKGIPTCQSPLSPTLRYFKSRDSYVDSTSEAFAKQLDDMHKVSCPWRGKSCAESLVLFPPTPLSALLGGFKDRCDGLLQFLSLPVIAASAVQQMRTSRCPQIDRLLAQSQVAIAGESGFKAESITGVESTQDDAFCSYSHAQKLISLCGWEPRWLPNIQDCEEHSAESARDGCSFGPTKDRVRPSQSSAHNKIVFPAPVKKDAGKKKISVPELRCESRSPMLDCSLCGATVRIWDFVTVPRPARFASNLDTTVTSKKMTLIRGVSAASGISGWAAADCTEKDQTECRDEAATHEVPSNIGVDLNLTMAAGVLQQLSFQLPRLEQFQDATAIGRDLRIGQPSGSVGDRAASYESRGPSTTHKRRSMEGVGSTVDRPLHLRMHQADSIEGSVIDRDGEEVNDGSQYSAGPSKRARDSDIFSSYRRDSSGAGPSHSLGFGVDTDVNRSDSYIRQGNSDQFNRDHARASSVIAMDTVGGHSSDEDSMESVENYPADFVDFQFSSPVDRNVDSNNNASELNYSNQAQQSRFFFFQPGAGGTAGAGGSSTNDGEEILNGESGIVAAPAMDRGGISFGNSGGGSIEMGVPSHEAEIHGNDASFQDRAADSVVGGDIEPIAEVTENQGQTGESTPCPAELLIMEDETDRQGDSLEDVMSIRSNIRREDSGSKVDDSAKEVYDSVESGGEKISHSHTHQDNTAHPSLSCNAMVYSGCEASKEEVTQAVKASSVNNQWESDYVPAGAPIGESNCEEAAEFDPIKHHNLFCPWMNGNVAAAGCGSSGGSSSGAGAIVLCGWNMTLDALDAFQSLEHIAVQTLQSESAASLYKAGTSRVIGKYLIDSVESATEVSYKPIVNLQIVFVKEDWRIEGAVSEAHPVIVFVTFVSTVERFLLMF
ncbi:hypothetical protein GIB67_031653 [Kingdonia uniflora]|uniref:C3HC-type domain-containing protein n=1 Tax=Kingdonia uniflora TaxID=39325 RepID=A0A7J7NKH1_9MAGN|nr:hypothetical protein GIB67_031653 [Kingdonia uniflora]